MTPRRVRRASLALAASALLLTGACGPADDDSASADPSGAPTAETGAAGATETAGGADGAAEGAAAHVSPLEELFGLAARTDDVPEEELQQQREVEERVVACMSEEGFEYVAVDPDFDPTGTSELYDLPPDEFAERYGYGITTIDVRARSEEARQDDPNGAVLDALSPEAQRAYLEALNGAEAAAAKYGEPIPADAAERPGCRAEAEHAVFGDSLEKTPPPAEFNPLLDEMDGLWDQILGDPRVAGAATAWADCMSEAGHSELEHPDDARTAIARRHWELYGLEMPDGLIDPEMDRRRGDKALPPPAPRGGEEPDPAALAELQDYEVEVALADRGCRPAYDEVVTEVQDEIEQAFIDDHRAELDQYLEAIALEGEDG